jgi:Sulfotransferase domain
VRELSQVDVSAPSRAHPVGRGARRLPDFVIVGAARSGTTALARYLGAHPGVFIPERKELNYFDRGDPLGQWIGWYCGQFAAARADQRVGEATPAYLFADGAAVRMAATIPDARLIAILRHPADRAYSHYWLARLFGYEERPFSVAIEDELNGGGRPGLEYAGYGRYVEQLERFRAYYADEALLVTLFEDMRADPAAAYAGCCRHVGVDDAIVPSIVGDRINQPLRQRSLALFRILDRWRNSRRPGFAIARFIAARNSVRYEPPPMDAQVRSALLEHFAPYNEALADLLGRNLSLWEQ